LNNRFELFEEDVDDFLDEIIVLIEEVRA